MRGWPRLVAVLLGTVLALASGPIQVDAYPRWGDPPYPDPAYFCPNGSPMDHVRLYLNDPNVAVNPEQNTFWGWHQNPGWDAWYGHWYGDFRGTYDDDSGWTYLMRVPYGQVGHWNFSSAGWQVHGHVTQCPRLLLHAITIQAGLVDPPRGRRQPACSIARNYCR